VLQRPGGVDSRLDIDRRLCEDGSTAESGREAYTSENVLEGGSDVTRTVRRLIGMTALAVLVAGTLFATAAGALEPPPGEGQPTSPGACFFGLDSTVPGPVTVTVSVLPTIDEPLTLQLFHNGAVVQSIVVNPPPALPISFNPINTVNGDTISVNYILRGVSTYSTGCDSPLGTVVTIQVAGENVAVGPSRLAFTGSSNTTRNALIAFAAIMFGAVLVIGTRRRSSVRS
jgi:hypothetical protein